MIGHTLGGRYQIVQSLGRGGFGETYLAEDTHLPDHPLTVLKKLKPQSTDPFSLQLARSLFDTEVKVLYKLGTHNQIPQLFAHFEENQEFYLVQEYINGHDLSHAIQSGQRLPETQVIQLLQDILDILSYVHQQRVIHRDIKPANLMRRASDGKIVMIDFGAVKQVSTQLKHSQGQSVSTIAIGTPGYMPSEQSKGCPKFCSDIYAVGMVAIQALTGVEPLQLPIDPNTLEIIWKNRASVSPNLADVLDKMVRYDFSQRYQSATDTLQALRTQVLSPTVPTNFSPTLPVAPPSPKAVVTPPQNPQKAQQPNSNKLNLLIIIGLGVLISAVVFALGFSLLTKPNPQTTPSPSPTGVF
ncbi:serine/threonine protein kinase [Microcoleus sp. FACHB-53]|nr:serine/threonine protein kinase [Microcoleus sp. FACHB-53]